MERCVTDLDLTVALVVSDEDARTRNARSGEFVRVRRRAVSEQLLAAAEHDRDGKGGHHIDEVRSEQRMDEFGAALGDEIGPVYIPQALMSSMSCRTNDPCQLVSTSPLRDTTYFLISLKRFAMLPWAAS